MQEAATWTKGHPWKNIHLLHGNPALAPVAVNHWRWFAGPCIWLFSRYHLYAPFHVACLSVTGQRQPGVVP